MSILNRLATLQTADEVIVNLRADCYELDQLVKFYRRVAEKLIVRAPDGGAMCPFCNTHRSSVYDAIECCAFQ